MNYEYIKFAWAIFGSAVGMLAIAVVVWLVLHSIYKDLDL